MEYLKREGMTFNVKAGEYMLGLEAENAKLREDRTHLGKMLHDSRAERDMLRQRLHMAEQQIRECRQYLRLDDRDLVVGHIDAYFALPALNSGEESDED